MQFVISQELAQGILNYLVGQAYGDVYQLIDGLKGLKTFTESGTMPPEEEEVTPPPAPKRVK